MTTASPSLQIHPCSRHSEDTAVLHSDCSLIASCLQCFRDILKTVNPRCPCCKQLITERSRFTLISSDTGETKGSAGLAPKMITGTTSKIHGMFQLYIRPNSIPKDVCIIF